MKFNTYKKWLLIIILISGPIIDAFSRTSTSEIIRIGPLSISQLVRGIFVIFMLISFKIKNIIENIIKTDALPLFIIGLHSIIMSPVRNYPIIDIEFFFRIVFICLIISTSYFLSIRREFCLVILKRVSLFILIVIIINQIVGYQKRIFPLMYGTELGFPGITGQPSLIGDSLATLAPIFLIDLNLSRINYIALIAIMASSIATLRRSSFLGIAANYITINMIHLFGGKKSRTRNLIIIFMFLCILAIMLFLTPIGKQFIYRMEDINIFEGGTASGRTIYWHTASRAIIERPFLFILFGSGHGQLQDMILRDFGISIGAHNVWLDITYALGFLGCLLLVIFYLYLIRNILRTKGELRIGYIAVFLALFILGVTTGAQFEPSLIPVYSLLGLLHAYRSRISKKPEIEINNAKNIAY